jgi:hypothetical protein
MLMVMGYWGRGDEHRTLNIEGKRNVGFWILKNSEGL